jgi:hypothetical protein
MHRRRNLRALLLLGLFILVSHSLGNDQAVGMKRAGPSMPWRRRVTEPADTPKM